MKLATKNLKMRQRKVTKEAQVYIVDTGGKSTSELFIEGRHRGAFTVPFHFLVQQDGIVEEGRKVSEIGDTLLNPEEDAIIVVVDSESDQITMNQVASLVDLQDSLQGTYKIGPMEPGDHSKWKLLMSQK